MNSNINAVFFGTGPVAAKSLEFIVKHFNVEQVITKLKPGHHRGSWPVSDLAKKLSIDTDFASNSQQIEQILYSKKLKAEVAIVIDFGIILSSKTIAFFPAGIINSHFSLLPKWRGADPITFTILKGEKLTGVSLMKLAEKMDEGPIIAQETVGLPATINSRQLSGQLINLSNQMLKKYLPNYLKGDIQPKQQTGKPSYSHKLQKSDGTIDWSKNANVLDREIRAYWQWPRSRAKLGSVELIISEATVENESGKPGHYVINDGKMVVFCGKQSLNLIKVQPAGKKPMPIGEFLRGYERKLSLS